LACRASRAAVAPSGRPAGDRAAAVKRQKDGAVAGSGVFVASRQPRRFVKHLA